MNEKNVNYHVSYCSCGSYILEEHSWVINGVSPFVFNPGAFVCLYCGTNKM